MKKFLFVFALLGFTSFALQAQNCGSKEAKSASNSKMDACCSSSAAAKAASLDDSIEKRVDEKTGQVSYVRRTVEASTGKAVFVPVEYNAEAKQFVNQSPDKKTECSKKEKAACHGTGKASTTSIDGKNPACCENGNTSCCKNGSKSSEKGKS